jgi:hypothetical protein
MTIFRRALTTALLIAGVSLVFSGLTAAQGPSLAAVTASAAAIAALLYAGAVWFGGGSSDEAAIIFDRDLTIASGRGRGTPVTSFFPAAMSRDLERHCRQALDGYPSTFSCASDPARRRFEAVPVRTADGTVAYGILLSGAMLQVRDTVDVA